MSERAERVGANEALFRAVNEKIEDLNEAFGELTGTMAIVCECGSAGCTEQIEVELPFYERIRDDAALFVVVSGHEAPDLEKIVERHEGYDVVRKHDGQPHEIAEELDPR